MITDRKGGKWFRGNLHTHTTRSDGRLDPADAAELYRSAGYDFLALTDHWVLSEGDRAGDMLLLPGCEYNSPTGDTRKGVVHIVGAGMKTDPGIARGADMQTAVDAINNAGGIAIYAHPAWSLNSPDQIKPFSGLSGVEIYNSTCGLPSNTRPYSGMIIDLLARDGYILPVMAADDTHSYNGDETKSFIMVNAAELTAESIMGAIRGGKMYASQGPELYLALEGDTITARTSPVEHIFFFSDTCGGAVNTKSGMTGATYKIRASDHFVRAEAVDTEGRYAWSQIIKIRNPNI
ncbi:MAG: CehA/McbA family metallohydrolase [Eubacteriales bacterium]|nr:CehA/McbA family metallohydrolase [Eubacteriales bacterium]